MQTTTSESKIAVLTGDSSRPITDATGRVTLTREDLDSIIGLVSFAPSGLEFNWLFDVRATPDGAWEVRASFLRPDTNTGQMGRGYGRWERIEANATVSSVVKTCYVCIKLIVEHELMEAFLYDGVRVFDPHHEMGDLTLAQLLGTRAPMFDGQNRAHRRALFTMLQKIGLEPHYMSGCAGMCPKQAEIVLTVTLLGSRDVSWAQEAEYLEYVVFAKDGETYMGFQGVRMTREDEMTPERAALRENSPFAPEVIPVAHYRAAWTLGDILQAFTYAVGHKDDLVKDAFSGLHDDHGSFRTED